LFPGCDGCDYGGGVCGGSAVSGAGADGACGDIIGGVADGGGDSAAAVFSDTASVAILRAASGRDSGVGRAVDGSVVPGVLVSVDGPWAASGGAAAGSFSAQSGTGATVFLDADAVVGGDELATD